TAPAAREDESEKRCSGGDRKSDGSVTHGMHESTSAPEGLTGAQPAGRHELAAVASHQAVLSNGLTTPLSRLSRVRCGVPKMADPSQPAEPPFGESTTRT